MKLHHYTMTDILNSEITAPPAIIKGWIWEQDNVILVGEAKASKSICGMQMAFCVSAGVPFLNYYEVPQAQNVLYLQFDSHHCISDRVFFSGNPALSTRRLYNGLESSASS
jgi:RecA-family ATPase